MSKIAPPPGFDEFLASRCGINIADAQDAELMALVCAELDKDIEADAVAAEQEQLAIAQANHSAPPQRAIDGMGPHLLSMSKTLFLHYKVNERLDFGSKKDRNWLTNRYPEIKVIGNQRTKAGVGFVSREGAKVAKGEIEAGQERNVRETVKYGGPPQGASPLRAESSLPVSP